MYRGLINGVLFFDLKKVFDTVDHAILTAKLRYYSIIGTALQWFKSYLNNRKQICKVNEKSSTSRVISCRVLPGSNLEPLLFLLYVNDLPKSLKETNPSLFADDTSLTFEAKTVSEIEEKLNFDIENVHN